MNGPSTSPRMLCLQIDVAALAEVRHRRAGPRVERHHPAVAARPNTRAPASSRHRASTRRRARLTGPVASNLQTWLAGLRLEREHAANRRSGTSGRRRRCGVTWRSRLPVSKSHACLQPGDVLPGDVRQRRVALRAGILSKRGPVARPSRRRLGRRPADRDRQQHGQNDRHPCVHGHGRVRLPQEDRRETTC